MTVDGDRYDHLRDKNGYVDDDVLYQLYPCPEKDFNYGENTGFGLGEKLDDRGRSSEGENTGFGLGEKQDDRGRSSE
jgi:hypothetical protein